VTTDSLVNAKLLANLVWYDGPLVALYRSVDGDLYIVSWQDCTDTANIWLWISVNRELAILYLRGEVDLLACLKKAEKMFMATVDTDNRTQWETTCFADLKEDELPGPGCVLSDLVDEDCNIGALVNLLVAEREPAYYGREE
jgi:hypothetical protein